MAIDGNKIISEMGISVQVTFKLDCDCYDTSSCMENGLQFFIKNNKRLM